MTRTLEKSSSPREEARWKAVIARDGSFDGQFYYSVETTGVYCRPSCAARLAKRSNVRFPMLSVQAFAPASTANRTGRRLPSYMRRWSHKPAD